MNREPVNPDDPQMTAYALGELSIAEAAEFEARLHDSPMARAELSSMREIMGLLSDGLRGEWQGSMERPALKLLEPVRFEESQVIVVGDFRPVRRSFAAAAAVAAVILVGGMIVTSQKGSPSASLASVESDFLATSTEEVAFSDTDASASVHVPQLFLAEEVDDMSRLAFVGEGENSVSPIDASYLDAGQVIPAGYNPASPSTRGVPNDRGQAFDRVDSYLPPLSGQGMTTGMIEKRLSKGHFAGSQPRHGDSVLVSGYVTMDGGLQHGGNNETLTGFRPVSISGNPVVNEGFDLQILSDLSGLQKELSEVVTAMPEGTAERAELEGILKKSRRIVSELKLEMAR